MILCFLGLVGTGKTASMSIIAKQSLSTKGFTLRIGREKQVIRVKKVIANYHLNLPGAEYSVFPLPELSDRDIMLIYDDIYTIPKRLQHFITFAIANLSRKQRLHILISAQRFTMIAKDIRTMSFQVYPRIRRIKKLAKSLIEERIFVEEPGYTFRQVGKFYLRLSEAFNIYNTYEKVQVATLKKFATILSRMSGESREFYADILQETVSNRLFEAVERLINGEVE